MGGRQYHLPRLPRAEYQQAEQQIRQVLDALIPGRYRIPLVMPDKMDFGDLDLLVDSQAMTPELFVAFAERTGAVEHRKVGNVQSFHVPVGDTGLQVDLFSTPADLLNVRQSFMDYGDLGNILGRMVRPYRLEWGDRGLNLIYRRDGDLHYRHDLPVPGGIDTVLELLKLDPDPLMRGFASERGMYDWTVRSPDFCSETFLMDNGAIQKRTKNRPGIARFQAYLREMIGSGQIEARDKMLRQDVGVLLGRLPADVAHDLRVNWDEQVRLEQRARELDERFTGTRLRDLRPDLEQMAFELMVRQIKNLPADTVPGGEDWMLEHTPEEVRAYLLSLQGTEITPQMRQSWEQRTRTDAKRAAKKKAAQERDRDSSGAPPQEVNP